jgi:hypothetical protein
MRDQLRLTFALALKHDYDQITRLFKKSVEGSGLGYAMSLEDLVKKTSLHPSKVRYAIKKLKEQELLIEKLKMNDLRQINFSFV